MNDTRSNNDDRLDAVMAKLHETVADARKRTAAAEHAEAETRLAQCSDRVRMVPNGFLRSALFGVVRNKGAQQQRQYLKRQSMAAVNGVEILYTGERLDQSDLDVWEGVLHAVRKHPFGCACRVTTYALLKAMGKTDCSDNRASLHDRIVRLRANAVEIRQGRYHYIGGLIRSAVKDEVTQEWVIELDDKMLPLLAYDQFTYIKWQDRRALANKQLAKWLHGYYMSHARPHPVKISTLQKLCGSQATQNKFTQLLKAALQDVAEVCAKNGTTFSWEIVDGLVYVKKS